MFRFTPFAALSSFFIPILLVAATDPVPVLTLDVCVARALDKNFDLEIQRTVTESARASVVIAEADYDPDLQLSLRTSGSRNPNTETTSGLVTSHAQGRESQLSVSQKLVTGATVTASGALDRGTSSPSRSSLNPAYDSDVSLSISQPLLRGRGASYNRAAIERARLGVNRADDDFKGAVLDLVRAVERAYYSVGFAREQLAVRAFSLEVAGQLFDENTSKRNAGVVTDLDVLQAEVSVANARRNLLTAEQAVHDAEDNLLALIGQFSFDETLGQIGIGEIDVPAPSFDRSYRLARENRPDYASSVAFIEQLKIDARVAASDRQPSLAVGGAAGYNAREGSAYRATDEIWDGDGYEWQLNATLSFPWGLRAENSRYSQSLISLRREETRLRQLDQNIVVEVRAAIRAVETNRESVSISAQATELSRRQYELEKARYDAGLSTFRRVQESQEDFDNARVAELQARVNLRTALADLDRLDGSSLERYRIVLP